MTEAIERLPALERRLRAREIDEILAAAAAHGGVVPTVLLRLADDRLSRAAAHRAGLEALRARHAEARGGAARIACIVAALRAEAAPARALRAARRGWLDLDAMAERAERAAFADELRGALALRLAAACAGRDDAATVAHALIERLAGAAPRLGGALCEALTELCDRAPEALAADARRRLAESLAALFDRPRRLQAKWAALALTVAPSEALAAIARRLDAPALSPDDFIVRQHLVTLLGARVDDRAAFFVLASAARQPDASEHVRLALPGALACTGGAAACAPLHRLAADASPRVRAQVAIALASLRRAGAHEALAPLVARLADADALVTRIAAEELAALADDGLLSASERAAIAAAARDVASAAATTAAADPALELLDALARAAAPELARARTALSFAVAALAPGRSVRFATTLDAAAFGRVLASLARRDVGLYARPVDGGYQVWRGAELVRRAWRILHEVRARTPYKRQDGLHTIARHFPGTLRAHAAGLAEATHTVPGEPLYVPSDGAAGPHLPTVDDLLSTDLVRDAPVTLYSTRGVVRIVPPPTRAARLQARVQLSARYVELAELRLRALQPGEPSERTRYLDAVEALGFRVTLAPVSDAGTTVAPLVPAVAAPFGARAAATPAAVAALALVVTPDAIADAVRYVAAPVGNTIGQLGVAAVAGLGVLLGRNLLRAAEIRRDRAAIPLVIGGWGTRGKSGTERLKAALFHGLDVEVLVKTTGCEAMFIHGVPGRRPTEIFIHRAYDKATIWEQRDQLRLAARLGVPVFLYECMALAPPLVDVVQQEWMRDDLSTLTNAYPDHEDIQGPAGHDVARSIARFIRKGGTTLTSEEQMLPIFVDEARRKGARLVAIGFREHALLGEDLLRRFPYSEHPRNIALVRRLAVELGDDPDLATADMAEHVVADLGVLKRYPEATHRGRRLTFINGMSANERTGFVSNWERTGCERAVDESGRWVVTVVNNRYDRVARSKAFADILVRDAAAERHVLIGTNLAGLVGYARAALEQFLDEVDPFAAPELRAPRLARVRHRLRVGAATTEAVLRELSAFSGVAAQPLAAPVAEALAVAAAEADRGAMLAEVIAALDALPLAAAARALCDDGLGEERRAFLSRSIARRALVGGLERLSGGAAASARFRSVYRDLFADLLVPVWDAGASGDQVIDAIARACPPGAQVTLMGTQNIKGTGLDFVYRWLRYDEVSALVGRLEHGCADDARAAASELASRSDWGMLDARLAAAALDAGAQRFAQERSASMYLTQIGAQIAERAAACEAKLQRASGEKRSVWIRVAEKTLDALDSVARRRHADRVIDALVHGEIGHERAALEMRKLNEREKKGWLRRS